MAVRDIFPGVPGKRGWRLGLNGAVLVLAGLAAVAAAVLYLSGGHGQGYKRLDVAISQLETDVRNDPQNADKRIAVANAYSARGLYQNAVTQFQQALTLRPDDQEALLGLGKAFQREGDLDPALQPDLRVAALNDKNPLAGTIPEIQALYYDLGQIYFQKGQMDDASRWVQKALDGDQTDADAWYLAGEINERNGDFDKAANSYGQAVRFAPNFVDAYGGMQRCYSRLGMKGEEAYARGMTKLANHDTAGAIKDLEQATQLSPQFGPGFEGLGLAYEGAGRPDDAIGSFRTALQIDPKLMLASLGIQRLQATGQGAGGGPK